MSLLDIYENEANITWNHPTGTFTDGVPNVTSTTISGRHVKKSKLIRNAVGDVKISSGYIITETEGIQPGDKIITDTISYEVLMVDVKEDFDSKITYIYLV